MLGAALGALETQNDLLGRLGLLVEHRLGLATETLLLGVVAALALRVERRFAGLVLRHFVLLVRAAVAVRAECVSRLRDVHHS